MLMQYILDTQPIQIDVYNAMGSKVVTINNQFAQYTLPVTLTNQPPGLYLLRITNYKNHSFNLKFVKK